MSDPLRFDGRVVLVTGAAHGLGREYALLFAKRGASVVVNDLGGSVDGQGNGSRAADSVVQEIVAAGGKAVANYDSVEAGEKVVQTALEAYGRIDVVINNAGILRDRSFARTSDTDWDLVHKVHLRGSFQVTRAAWPHMQKQKYGRVIMTSSASGIYGNFGQANYSAAKLGILGLANTLAIEGAKYNIQCNTIAPTAGSRMTETVMPPDMVKALKPEFVAPLVMYLCHESCAETHALFEVGAGWVSKLRWQRTKGVMLRSNVSSITPEAVRDSWPSITSFQDPDHPETMQDNVTVILGHLQRLNTAGRQPSFDLKRALATKFPADTFSVTSKALAMYALGVGATVEKGDLRFLYENDQNFAALPTFGVIPAQSSMSGVMTGGVDGLDFNPMMLLHGEQYIELHNPMPTEGNIKSQASLVNILDKGSGIVLIVNVDTTSVSSGQLICRNQYAIFIRGLGGFGGQNTSSNAKPTVPVPSGPPCAIEQDKTGPSQAALYRLNGDLNPLHIDPDMAAVGGFDRPILHGLCTFGYAARHVLKAFGKNDPEAFKCFKVRFSAPVYPGETIETQMWKRGGRVHFQCRVVERDVIVLANAYADLKAPPAGASTKSELKAAPLFDLMKSQLTPELVKEVKAIYQWNIKKDGKVAGKWTVDLKNGSGAVYEGAAKEKAGCTLTLNDNDVIPLATGKLNPMQAYLKGKLKVGGNIMLSQKLQAVFAKMKAAGKVGLIPTAGKLQSSAIFESMANAVNKDLVNKIRASYQWNITEDGKVVAQWFVNLKSGDGEVGKGEASPKADCSITVADKDLVALAGGKLNPMKAFMSGKLKIKGNIMLAQKLQALFEAQEKSGPSFQAENIFNDMNKRITPELCQKVNAVVQWNITAGDKTRSWTADLKQGQLYDGPAKSKADCTLILADQTLVDLTSNKLTAMKAFMSGKLKVKGNITIAQKLQGLFAVQSRL